MMIIIDDIDIMGTNRIIIYKGDGTRDDITCPEDSLFETLKEYLPKQRKL